MAAKKDVDAGMIRGGSEEGMPTVAFDKAKRRFYHLDSEGNRVYHEVPAGYALDDNGAIYPLPEVVEEATVEEVKE